MIEALLNLMSRALEGIQGLPWGIHAMVAVGLAVGLVLWLVGNRVLKPLVVTLAALLGGVIGGMVVPSTSWGASLTPWHGIGIGAVAGLLVGLLMYRSAMAVGFGAVLGAALPLVAVTILHFYPVGRSSQDDLSARWVDSWSDSASSTWESRARDDYGAEFRIVRAAWQNGQSDVESGADRLVEKLPDNLKPVADSVSTFWENAKESVSASWSEMPTSHRGIVAICAAGGVATGVVTGLMLPGWAAAAVTSMFGAAVWMSCLVWLSNAFSAPWRGLLDRTAPQWLAAWAVAAVIGLVIQRRMRRKGRKPAPAAAAG